jgi:hypothetical protein
MKNWKRDCHSDRGGVDAVREHSESRKKNEERFLAKLGMTCKVKEAW